MTIVDGLLALGVILGFFYIIAVKMKEKSKGQAVLGWLSEFTPRNLFLDKETPDFERKNQTWTQKREII